ncbi:hypothetical protein RHMOL_Rhmol04G0338700 [Rhododendron molle]|uniref:Uncharacterized protein n=1 Tax=Rhododendron molle TaxID=49168 RepID=A0ACC0P739_RHOML|nr:hypothetical protein RHMOL_Rhmol04G0338700 [Rhododendron molle]
MEEPGRLTRRRKKEGVIVKCETSLEYPAYEKTFCFCVAEEKDPNNPREWYMLKISNKKDKEKEAEEKVAKKVSKITDAELREAYLAFHHDDCHQGELDQVPMLSSVVKLKLGKSFRIYGASCASVGSFIYGIGGYCGKDKFSRNVRYFDSSRPEEGLKTALGGDLSGKILKALVSLPIEDSKIRLLINASNHNPFEMRLILVHLAGDLFCLLWMGEGEDRESVHYTKIRVSTQLGAVFVLACHRYCFHHMVCLLDCLPL